MTKLIRNTLGVDTTKSRKGDDFDSVLVDLRDRLKSKGKKLEEAEDESHHGHLRATLSRYSSSLLALLEDSSTSALENRIEEIRSAMLECLAQSGNGSASCAALLYKIKLAPCVQTLWFLRVDLMADLAFKHGEATARQRLQHITALFRGELTGQQTQPERFANAHFYALLIAINAALIWQNLPS